VRNIDTLRSDVKGTDVAKILRN